MGKQSTITYGLALAGLAGKVLEKAAEGYFQEQSWWSAVPFDVIALFSAGLLLGLLVQDGQNGDSWIRQRWSPFAAIFDVNYLWWEQEHDPIRREVVVKLAAVRPIKNAALRLWAVDPAHGKSAFMSRRDLTLAKGEEVRLVLFTCPVFQTGPENPRYGSDGQEVFNETPASYLVEIEMRAGLRRQTYLVQIGIHRPDAQWRITCQSEDQSPFRWAQPPTGSGGFGRGPFS